MRHTTTALRVHGHEVLGFQICKTGDATEIGLDTAIGCAVSDGVTKIGIATLHGNEATLLVATQVANVIGDGLSIPGFF
jgi:hypothetical protein